MMARLTLFRSEGWIEAVCAIIFLYLSLYAPSTSIRSLFSLTPDMAACASVCVSVNENAYES